jgi:hypothetical protein
MKANPQGKESILRTVATTRVEKRIRKNTRGPRFQNKPLAGLANVKL